MFFWIQDALFITKPSVSEDLQ